MYNTAVYGTAVYDTADTQEVLYENVSAVSSTTVELRACPAYGLTETLARPSTEEQWENNKYQLEFYNYSI